MTEELTNFLNSDDAIFHYTKRDTAINYILDTKKLKLNLLKNTNDPYEYKRKAIISCFIESEENEKKDFKDDSLEDIIQNTLFSSFCMNSENIQGYEKPRMWSQYGENHGGVCLVFSKELLLQTIKAEFSKNYEIYAEKINYQITPLDALTGVPIEYIIDNYENIFFQKHKDYRDEDEFRIVLVQKNKEDSFSSELFIDISNSLKLIILGDNFPKVNLPTIEHLTYKLGIDYKKLLWEDDQYYMVTPV